MEKYPCTCGGENPNCFRCDGTGLVASRALPLRSDGRVRPLPHSDEIQPLTLTRKIAPEVSKPIIKKEYFCPKCKELFFDPIEFVHHARNFHPKPKIKAITLKQPKQNKQRQIEMGPTAEAPDYKPMTLEVMTENQRLLNEARSALKSFRRLYPHADLCETCLEIFKTKTELVTHHKNSHATKPSVLIKKKKKTKIPAADKKQIQKSRQNNKKKTSGQNETKIGIAGQKTPMNPNDQHTLERRMDATYGMGGFARDHGQFGSAPTYDCMDDESSP